MVGHNTIHQKSRGTQLVFFAGGIVRIQLNAITGVAPAKMGSWLFLVLLLEPHTLPGVNSILSWWMVN